MRIYRYFVVTPSFKINTFIYAQQKIKLSKTKTVYTPNSIYAQQIIENFRACGALFSLQKTVYMLKIPQNFRLRRKNSIYAQQYIRSTKT